MLAPSGSDSVLAHVAAGRSNPRRGATRHRDDDDDDDDGGDDDDGDDCDEDDGGDDDHDDDEDDDDDDDGDDDNDDDDGDDDVGDEDVDGKCSEKYENTNQDSDCAKRPGSVASKPEVSGRDQNGHQHPTLSSIT